MTLFGDRVLASGTGKQEVTGVGWAPSTGLASPFLKERDTDTRTWGGPCKETEVETGLALLQARRHQHLETLEARAMGKAECQSGALACGVGQDS